MPTPLPLQDRIQFDSQGQIKQRTSSTQFGDGYSHERPRGLNAKHSTWNISWPVLTQAQCDAVVEVLDAVGSWDVVTWTQPNETVPRKFKVTTEGYSLTPVSGIHLSVSLALREAF